MKLRSADYFSCDSRDLGGVAEMCDRVLVMYGGVTAEYADVDAICTISRAIRYPGIDQGFSPDPTKPQEKLSSIPGYPLRLDVIPAGCRFAPRCPAGLTVAARSSHPCNQAVSCKTPSTS
ncbi:hypothetical protein [Candidatus Villigracilis saccharophilus]|uniref:hypothetical protein n=1 Tax=Candidatus Villigracilis saccharophilus TaxID=3140684 RepID=UPI003135B2CB|nr:hypothetical protein [Anaerolineales bacterium]